MAQATLNGLLTDDGGEACDVWFEYGTDTGYGTSTSVQSGFITGQSFSAVVTGLLPGTVYHYRAAARNSYGTSYGSDMSFVTPALVLPATGFTFEDPCLTILLRSTK